jgi:phage-related protein
MAIIGTASVKVRPDLSSFRKDLDAGLRSIKAEITVNVQADIKRAKATVDEFVRRESGQDINKRVNVDTKGAAAQIAAVTNGIGSAAGSASLFAGRLQNATVAATSIIAVTQALGPLLISAAGAAALLPAALIGAVGVLATVKLGADGAKAAFDKLTPTLNTLKGAVSATFEKSLTPAVNNLKTFLPGLTTGFQAIASVLGGVATQVTGMLNASGNVSKVNGILMSTSTIVGNIGAAIAPLIQAFINIGAIGAPIIAQLTANLGGAAQKFAAYTASAEGSAKISQIIQGSLDAFKQLGAILQQVVGIVTNVFTGISSGAGNLGGTVLPILTSINQALGSAAGQAALGALGSAVTALGQAFASYLGPAIQALLPHLTQIFTFIAQNASTIAPIVAGIGLFGGILSKVAGPLATFIPLISKIGPLFSGLFTLLKENPFILLATGIIAALAATGQLQPILGLIGQVLQPILAAIGQLVSALLPPLQALFTALTPVFTIVAQVIGQLVQALAPIIGLIAQMIGTLLPPLVSLFTSVLTPVLNLAAAFLGPIVGAIAAVIGWISNLLNQLGGVSGILNIVKNAFSVSWTFIKGVWAGVSGFFSGIWNGIVSGVSGALGTVKSWFSDAWSFIKGVWSGVGNFFSNVWSGITNGLKSGLNFAIKLLNGLISAANLIPGVNIPNIPYLAEGGTITQSGTVVVGEQGPELLSLNRGAQVTPLSGKNRAILPEVNPGGSGDISQAVADGLARAQFVIDPSGLARIVSRGTSSNARR